MSSIPLSAIPTRLHRLAAQLLEDMRANERTPDWEQAQLGALVRPLYRPDVDGDAYYEFSVGTGPDGSEPAGFIIVSTGDHDFPIAHWNSDGPSPCEELQLRAEEAGETAARFFKLDALAYAAENGAGELVATSDAQLVRVNGLDPAWLDEDFPLTEATWTPSHETEDDADADQIDGVLEVSGPEPIRSVELTGWESWDELKAEYAAVYSLLIGSLRRQASTDWEIDELAEQYGEGLAAEESYRLPCLHQRAEYELEGPGANIVEVVLVERGDIPPVLDIRVLGSPPPDEEFPLKVVLMYPEVGIEEVVRFAIVAPSQRSGYRTIELNPGIGVWSRWREWWAGTHNDQRWYDQISPHTSPNPYHCYSGCGNTAWAMLFGWGDYQADKGNRRWRRRWGLYRKNGGKGTDAVAPAKRDAGVTNMTWEIRNWTRTFCDPFSTNGVTPPWDMERAAGYLRGRTGTRSGTLYQPIGLHRDRIRDTAIRIIKYDKDPVIIGIGWLSHYPLAYGYRQRWRRVRHSFLWCTWYTTEYGRQFFVNQGGGGSKGWIPASTWFAGWITPD